MPGARTLRCAAHRSVRSTGGLAPPARACSGITRRPLAGDLTGWPANRQGLCRYASRACSGSAAPAGVSTRRERLTAMPGHQAGKAPSNRRTLAGVQQSGPEGCSYTAGRISSERATWQSSIAEGRAGVFTGRGVEAARVFQQGQWALAGRAMRNPSAACPCGSH